LDEKISQKRYLPIIELGIMMVFENGSSSTGITVTSNLFDAAAAAPLGVVLGAGDGVVVAANVFGSLVDEDLIFY